MHLRALNHKVSPWTKSETNEDKLGLSKTLDVKAKVPSIWTHAILLCLSGLELQAVLQIIMAPKSQQKRSCLGGKELTCCTGLQPRAVTEILALWATHDLLFYAFFFLPSTFFTPYFHWIHVSSCSRLLLLQAFMENEHPVTYQTKVSVC